MEKSQIEDLFKNAQRLGPNWLKVMEKGRHEVAICFHQGLDIQNFTMKSGEVFQYIPCTEISTGEVYDLQMTGQLLHQLKEANTAEKITSDDAFLVRWEGKEELDNGNTANQYTILRAKLTHSSDSESQ